MKVFSLDNYKSSKSFAWGLHAIIFFVMILCYLVYKYISLDLTSVIFKENKPETISFVLERIEYFADNKKDDLANFIFGLAMAVYTSYVASGIFSNKIQSDDEKLGHKLGSLSKKDLVEFLINDLSQYKKRYLEDYFLNLELYKSDFDNVLILSIDYQYKTFNKPENEFVFRICRNETTSDVHELENLYEKFELHQIFNDIEFINDPNYSEIQKMYKISNIIINHKKPTIKIINNDYYVEMKCTSNKAELYMINFRIEVPVGFNSFNYVSLDLPTNKFQCKFNYGKLKDKIDVSTCEFIGSNQKTETNMQENEQILISRSNWTYPACGLVFVWWKK